MAELNPLKFAVAIQDEATGKLNDIERKFGELKDKTISVKVEGIDDLRNLLAMLNQKQPSNVGNSVSQEVEKTTAALKKEEEELERLKKVAKDADVGATMTASIEKAEAAYSGFLRNNQKALREFFRTGSLPNTAESAFNAIISRIEKAKQSISDYKAELDRLNGVMASLNSGTKLGWTTVTATGNLHDQLDVANKLYSIMGKISGESGAKQIQLSTENSKKAIAELGKIYNKTYTEAEAMVRGLFSTGFAGFGKFAGGLTTTLDLYQLSIEKIGKASDKVVRKDELSHLIKSQSDAIRDGEKQISMYEQRLQKLKSLLLSSSQENANDPKIAQVKAQIAQQEQKVAEAKERLAQATQQQSQATQKEAQDIKVTGDAMQRLGEQYQQLAQNSIKTALDAFTKDLKDIKTAIQNDNFTAFAKRIESCSEAINKLSQAFTAFKVVIGDNQELKDLLSGWGAAIREVSAAIGAMNAAKNSGKTRSNTQKEDLKQEEQGLIKVANALGMVKTAASGSTPTGGIQFMESINRTGEANIQTLIKEQAHIERLIEIARKSISFGEGHPVLGMGRLRGDQMGNLKELEGLKKVISEILFAANQGDQAMIRFLNTMGALRTTPISKDAMGNDVTLLGGHFDKLVVCINLYSSR